jgi:hypothetical protein
MRRTLLLSLCAALALTPWAASPLGAQAASPPHGHPRPLLAHSINDLQFGNVFPGIPVTVAAGDSRRAALFEVEGPSGMSVRVEITLPAALLTHEGARLPVRFGPGDGYADFSRGNPSRGLRFDPNGPVVGSLGPNGQLYIRLGGTAEPERGQTSGWYRATIFLTVYDVGT